MRAISVSNTCAGIARMLASAFQSVHDWLTKSCWQSFDQGGCHLLFAEKTFSIDEPIKLTVRVDRAYRDGSALTLMELKTRNGERVYPSDVIELSAQRLAVEHSTGERVHDFGYIVLQHPVTRRRSTHMVSLLSQDDVIGIARRQKLLIVGALPPRHASNPECCRQCEYQSECRYAPRHT